MYICIYTPCIYEIDHISCLTIVCIISMHLGWFSFVPKRLDRAGGGSAMVQHFHGLEASGCVQKDSGLSENVIPQNPIDLIVILKVIFCIHFLVPKNSTPKMVGSADPNPKGTQTTTKTCPG